MNVTQVKCPSCNSPIYMKQKDRMFYCDKCNVMHTRDEGVEKVDFEVGEFSPSAPQGEKVFVPFWRVYATFQIRSKQVEGGTIFKLTSWLKGGNDSGNMFIYVPACALDPGSFKMMASQMTTRNPRYATRLNFGGMPRIPVAMSKKEAAELADFVVVTMEAEQPGVLQQLDYSLTVNDTKIIYLPYIRTASGLMPAL
jgi:hypothetical protein